MVSKNYYILYKKSSNQLPLGDIIRVLHFFKDARYNVVTNKKNNNFFKIFNSKNVIDINKFKVKKKYKLINLIIGKKISESTFDINNYIDKKFDKTKTFNIFSDLSKLNIKRNKKKSLLKKNKNIKIGINWRVPIGWKIKCLPKKKWKFVTKKLSINNVEISLQGNLNLSNYVKWIKSCDKIISIVGLGVHIGSYFNKKVFMLVGPTDFKESSKDNNIIKIITNKRCAVHQKKMNIYSKKCNCMKMIDEKKLVKRVLKNINEAK